MLRAKAPVDFAVLSFCRGSFPRPANWSSSSSGRAVRKLSGSQYGRFVEHYSDKAKPMTSKPTVLVDPSFRRMDEIFSEEDMRRMPDIVDVIWGRSEPMPLDDAVEALTGADAVVCSSWRYGDVLHRAQNLRAIMSVSGAFSHRPGLRLLLRQRHPRPFGCARLRPPSSGNGAGHGDRVRAGDR